MINNPRRHGNPDQTLQDLFANMDQEDHLGGIRSRCWQRSTELEHCESEYNLYENVAGNNIMALQNVTNRINTWSRK